MCVYMLLKSVCIEIGSCVYMFVLKKSDMELEGRKEGSLGAERRDNGEDFSVLKICPFCCIYSGRSTGSFLFSVCI